MPYPLLSITELKNWNDAFEQLNNQLAAAQTDDERANVTNHMRALGNEVKHHLDQRGETLQSYFTQHFKKVDNWNKLAEKSIKAARKAADAYKKDPRGGTPPQIQQAVEDLRLWEAAIGEDGNEMGAAWRFYRTDGEMNKIPVEYKTDFFAIRSRLMDEQKDVTNVRTKIKGYHAEAEGLLKVAAKVTMKAGIKAGTGVQRPLEEALADAKELAKQMAAELELVNNPPGTATAPGTIRTIKQSIRENASDRTFAKTPGAVTLLNSRKNLVKSGLKLMKVRVTGMEKLLAVKTKGFRKNELTNGEVRGWVRAAEKTLKDAQKALKTTTDDANKALTYAAQLEARWKSKQ